MGIFDRTPEADPKRDRFEELCSIVDMQFQQFRKAGNALREIRDDGLYRYSHESFAAFCRDRWKITERHAIRLITANSICELLGEAGELIENERQARQVARLEPEARQAFATEITTHGTHISEALKKHLPTSKKTRGKTKPIRLRLPSGTLIIEPNKRFISVLDTIEQAVKKLEQKHAA